MSSESNVDDINDNKKFEKLEDALNETKQRLACLRSHLSTAGTALVTDESRIAVWKLSRSYFDWPDWRQQLCAILLEEKYPEMAVAMAKQLFDIGPAVNDATSKFSLNLLASLWNFSKFVDFRRMLGSARAVLLFLDYLVTVQMHLEHGATKEPPEQYPLQNWAILKIVLNVLHQLAKHQDLIGEFHSNRGVQVFGKLATIDNNAIKFVSLCCLAFIACGNEYKPLDDFTAIFFHGLDQALKSADNPHYQGLELQEIADAFYLFVSKSDPTENNKLLSDKQAKIGQITGMIVGENDLANKCGATLFRAYCHKDFEADWLTPIYDVAAMSQGEDVQRTKGIKATAFLTDYQAWLKTRRGEPLVEKDDLTTIEIACFATKKNGSLKTSQDLIGETEIRVKFLAKLALLTPDRLVNAQVLNVFKEMRTSYFDFESKREELLATVVRERLPAVAAKYLSHFLSVGLTEAATYPLSCTLLSILWNFTDLSPPFRLDLAKAGVLKALVAYLAAASKPDIGERSSEENYLISAIINIVYNMSRSMELKVQFLELNAANILKEYLGISELIKSIVILCLAHILSDTPEAAQLALQQGVVTNIIEYTNAAMKEIDHKCYTGDGSYSLHELVEGLALLAVNDSIKETLMQSNACGIISFLLKSEDPNLETLGVDLLWTLSFQESARNQILTSEEKLIDSLRSLTTSPKAPPELRDHATKTLDFVEKWQKKMAEAEAYSSSSALKKEEGHIFISYSWDQQRTVLQIRQELIKSAYKVWMDIDNMHGELLEAMSEAIEKASVVLICFSNSYKQSNPCRTEAQYTHALCKPVIPVNMEYHYFPDGWLGILVRSRKFVDMSLEKRPFEVAFEHLLNELKALGAITSSSSSVPHEISSQPLGGGHSTTQHDYTIKETVTKLKCYNWSVDDVRKWLERKNLTEFEPAFANFDGEMLTTLISMKSTAPEFYHQTVSKYCCNSNGTFCSMMKLFAALDRLILE